MGKGPVYVKVSDGKRPLRVTARARSGRQQLVRISAAEAPSKLSKVWWFDDRELRPSHDQRVEMDIPPVGLERFWLVLHVFSTAGNGWHRSTVKPVGSLPVGSLQVPEDELVFDDDGDQDDDAPEAASGVVLSLAYRDADDR